MTKPEIDAIADAFTRAGLAFRRDTLEDSTFFSVPFGTASEPPQYVGFSCFHETGEISAHICDFVPKSGAPLRPRVLRVLNDANRVYRFAGFSLGCDGDVRIDYRFPNGVPIGAAGAMCAEVYRALSDACLKVRPALLRAIGTNDAGNS